MRLVHLALFLTVLGVPGSAWAGDFVLLAGSRDGWVVALHPDTFETVARIKLPDAAEGIASDDSGQRLLVRMARGPGKGCCGLFALDTASMQLSLLVESAQFATVSAGMAFTQRGNTGIEAFDLADLTRLPTIQAPGVYRLRASPDGRRLFGLTNWPRPSLDLFDTVRRTMLASRTMPEGSDLAGSWLGKQYYLLSQQQGQAVISPVDSDSGEPGTAVRLSPVLPSVDCPESPSEMIAVASKLAIYSRSGGKSDGRCGGPGGFVLADPVSGARTNRFAPQMRFWQMTPSPDGRYLYGLDVGSPDWSNVRVVKLDAATGQIAGQKHLDAGVWYLATGQIPDGLVGRLDLTAVLAH